MTRENTYLIRFSNSGETLVYSTLKHAKAYIKFLRSKYPNHTQMRIYKLIYKEKLLK